MGKVATSVRVDRIVNRKVYGLILAFFLGSVCLSAFASSHEDWQLISEITDDDNAELADNIDIQHAWIEQSGDQLRFTIQTYGPITTSYPSPNDVGVFLWLIDADQDSGTGQPHGGVGSEFNVRAVVSDTFGGGFVDVTGGLPGGGTGSISVGIDLIEIIINLDQISSPESFTWRAATFEEVSGVRTGSNADTAITTATIEPVCEPFLFLLCPGQDAGSFVEGCTAQVNGAVSSVCGPSPITWDWGDGSPAHESFFPSSHDYAQNGQFTVTATAGEFLAQCVVDLTECSLPPPSIDSFVASPENISFGGTTTLSWSVSGANSCTASGGDGGWAGSDIAIPDGSAQVTLNGTGEHTFTLSCDNDFGSDSKDVVVTVEGSPVPLPDLVMVRITSALSEVGGGQSFQATATVSNEGDGAADASTVRFYLSPDSSIGGFDPELKLASLVSLNAGEETDLMTDIPASVMPGTYFLGACVDEVAGETDAEDNCVAGPLITVTGEDCESAGLACGQSLAGNLDASSCTGGPLGSSYYAGLFMLNAEPGETLIIEADWSFDGYLLLENPSGVVVAENDNFTDSTNSRIEYQAAENGEYRIWATTYAPGTVGSFDLGLGCGSPGGPDLEPDPPAVSSIAPDPGQTLTIEARLRNIGDHAADSTILRYLLSSDSTIDTSDAEMRSDGTPALAAGEETVNQVALSAPGAPGPYWIGVCADAVSGEAVAANNCSAGRRIDVSEAISCSSRPLNCGAVNSSNLNAGDCTGSPRGAGYYAEEYTFPAQAGIPLQFGAQWADVDGYLYLVGPSGRVVAQNDDYLNSGAGESLIEYTPDRDGIYRLWATTYARNSQGGFGLNTRCGKASAPDLVASNVSVDDSMVEISQAVGVSARVRNVGDQGAPATTALFKLSNDPEITASDQSLASLDVAALGPKEEIDISTLVTAPDSAGSYWLGLCVDVVTGESRTTNNCSQLDGLPALSLQSAASVKPGLRAEDDNGTLLEVVTGNDCDAIEFSCGQSTNGALAHGDCDLGPRGAGYRADSYTLAASAGDTVSLNARWAGMDGILYLQGPEGEIYSQNDDFQDSSQSRIEVELDIDGNYTVWPTAFDQGDISGSYTLGLECNDPAAPDLASDTPTLSATQVRPGQSLGIKTRVRNNGRSSAGATKLRYYLATSQSVTENDRLLGAGDIPQLAEGDDVAEDLTVPLNATPGSYYVVTCADLDPLELELENNCASNGPVTIEQDDDPISINTGLNDAWYNPETDRQGFFINVFPDTRLMFLSWFTYDTERPPNNVDANLGDPGHRWLTAQGNYELGVAKLDVTLSEGGTFDSPTPAVISEPGYGTMSVSFSDCNTGEILFDLPSAGESGAIPITRVVDDNVQECEDQIGALEHNPPGNRPDTHHTLMTSAGEFTMSAHAIQGEPSGSSFNYSPLLNDAWYNPETDGQGFFFNVFPDLGLVFLSWFTYETERPPMGTPYNLGEPGHRWLTAQGPFSGNTATLSVTRTRGGIFNQAHPMPQSTPDGTITATFTNCNEGVVNYDIESIDQSGSVPIQRITRDALPGCEKNTKNPGVADPESVVPIDKTVLENECGKGSVNWVFDWPDDPNIDTYVFWLSRNDSQAGGQESPYLPRLVSESRAVYSKKASIEDAHLEGWEWVYAPYGITGKPFGKKGGRFDGYEKAIEGRRRYTFSVQAQSECLD